MATDRGGGAEGGLGGRCRCGHFPSQHMLVRPIPDSASYRLEPSGPCSACGASRCRSYTPEGRPPAEARRAGQP